MRCKNCRKPLITPFSPDRPKHAKYCSEACKRQAFAKRRRELRKLEWEQARITDDEGLRECEWCDDVFRPLRSHKRFHSGTCQRAMHRWRQTHPGQPTPKERRDAARRRVLRA